ncbi:MAG: hypothetical protein UR69_C0001G0298 [Candidatus Moranbacteria bacterium GW2011_GWE2_35_2-]|nr:MAG: hypothetical protein UR69_C0001G0298 [Candidatus Moranbacteria bacterium GW2011_GWE2_35_2-]KKQ21960.1 MAG: hypothetical protein US37_C0005G0002 [Candidatus Moranbacteria bacterium GW2011_GWF2_37_11]KKQ31065.1 MAG: hypothetical protein US47_C0001G0298 [Candidatus Moranbacteria bacterium GW2011_GWE1_37_24]KKQ46561.1 MAG: hypothetical protein US66_C0037G0002 [Candidatus Moranbacteria bacterium GW2011_GWD2_37_9]HBO16737.1 hypothetical protein [Candidatus Moranbacteria bacterium]
MQEIRLKIIFLLVLIFFGINVSNNSKAASLPILNFSDLINGPKSGLGDGLGEGAIVTIWGNNLGSSQGTSKVYFKDSNNSIHEAAHVYYWKNADGQLPGGPSDLYTSHKMQEIAFSIPSAVADGAGKIYVEVEGVNSTELDFYARSDGIIRFVKAGGVDSGVGSWVSPWATMTYAVRGNTAGVGDIIYVTDMTLNDRLQYGSSLQLDGIANNNVAMVAYPNSSVVISTALYGAVQNFYTRNDFWVFSKLRVFASGGACISGSSNGRVVANNLQQVPGTDAFGQAGAIIGAANNYTTLGYENISNLKVFGNYIHDYGGPTTSNKEHATYFSLRSDVTLPAPEIGWNRLEDNIARFGIHFYDENGCGSFSGTFSIHNNWIENQVGPGINIGTLYCDEGTGFDASVDVYDNILINTGLYSPVQMYNQAISLYGTDNTATVRYYNNTIYGYGEAENTENSGLKVHHQVGSEYSFGGTYEWKNNIVVDTKGYPFILESSCQTPLSINNNLWFSVSNTSLTLPSWDSIAVNQNPLFTSPFTNDFTLQSTSPAINAGTTLASIPNDFLGVSRPQGISYDIGAFEYVSAAEETCSDNIQNQDETGIDCGGVCEACIIPTTYTLTNFISAITNWLQIGNTESDVNSDGIVNTRDLGVVMSNWSN